jgi:hypothetical protein
VGVGSTPRINETQQLKENENWKERQSKLVTQLGKLVLLGRENYS